jgi:hypothetical protein
LSPVESIRTSCGNGHETPPIGPSPHLKDQIVIIDEPENGLHRAAELPLAQALVSLASLAGFKPVVATHSPAFVRAFISAGAATWKVAPNEHSEPTATSYRATDLSSLAEICGLSTPDIIQLVRLFVLVEGEHDKAVLQALFGDHMAELGVAVIPIRGVHGAPQILDSSFLWTFADARVVLLLDHLDNGGVSRVWEAAKRALQMNDMAAALSEIEYLHRLERSGRSEIKAVYELFAHIIENRTGVDRIRVEGLSEPDIINYFHPTEIVRLDSDYSNSGLDRRALWKQLEAEWRRLGGRPPFKQWLCERFPGTRIDVATLSAAVARWDAIPDDLAGLLHKFSA